MIDPVTGWPMGEDGEHWHPKAIPPSHGTLEAFELFGRRVMADSLALDPDLFPDPPTAA